MKRRILATVAAIALMAAPLVGSAYAADPPQGPATPGTVVSVTDLPRALWVAGTGRAYRVTYRTTDSLGHPALSSGAVFVPEGKAPEGGWPVVSWTHGTVGLDDSCAPSTAGRSQRDMTYLATWMSQGYAVVSTDYIGLGTPGVHAYLDGRAEGQAAVDMVRAGRAVDGALSRKWVAIGQSQGGQAALVTASLATRYGPELDYRGAVATGPASNIVSVATLLVGPLTPDVVGPATVAYFAYIFRGLQAARPDFDMADYLSPLGAEVVADAERLCYADLERRVEDVELRQLLRKPLGLGDFGRTAHPVMDVPVSGYDRPFFIGQGTADQDVPAPLNWKLAADLTLNGQKFTFRSYDGADHSATMTASLPDTIPFVRDLFAGPPAA
ncbi:lipase family protein [Streptomyces sp. B1866]|uniref:lipase family protein n=1 Tax=Streptomyces sp. B1866 TaxID=3075431 RepID=UPI00289146A1|nr:lipase family protein [Streptomyces sp. B1866]MDT3399531.1 lipase family protein [Streptomyces sp. B1866]